MTWTHDDKWRELVSCWVGARPTASHPEGLAHVRAELITTLRGIGFQVEVRTSDLANEQPILVARRPGASERWLGISSHYDVEEAPEQWRSDPWSVCKRDGRLYGRGLADNLGPLAQRLLSCADIPRNTGAGIVWVIEGEEELGSPWAQRLYPRLELPPVTLWLEETGYFYKDGVQRVLTNGPPQVLDPIITELSELAATHGRAVRVRHRFLNKAFGQDRCPVLRHLVDQRPYLAIGPNDDWTRIHAPDESIDPALLELCDLQFRRLVQVLA